MKLTLGSKLLLAFLAVGILPFAAISIISLSKSSNALESQAIQQLEAVREIKKAQIEKLFSDTFKDIKLIASLDNVKNYFIEFENIGLSEGYKSEDYEEAAEEYTPVLKSYVEGYNDFYLIGEQGDVVYSLNRGEDFGVNLFTSGYKNTGLAIALKKALTGNVAFIDIAPYAPLNNAPASFVAAPLRGESGTIFGVAALRLSLDAINSIMMERTSMGESGETYLVGMDSLLRSDSYEGGTVVEAFSGNDTGKVDTDASRNALSGKAGSGIIISYNGHEVLSAYSPLSIDNTTWALIAEMDTDEALAPVNSLRWLMVIIAIIGITLIIAVALVMTRFITGPIKNMVGILKSVAAGDLTRSIEVTSDDEIGMMAYATSEMVKKLKKVVGNVKTATDSVASGSQQLSSSSNEMSQGALKQAEKASQIATSTSELAHTVVNISGNAANIASSATDTLKVAQDGEIVVRNTIREVQKISNTVLESSEVMTSLGNRSQQIGEIVGVINDIAKQTNLLALNAAIEAARAGEQGRGFAVVADEVRKLAENTAKATNQINEMIKAMQDETGKAVSSMEESSKKVEAGVELSTQAGNSLKKIVESVNGLQSMVEQIASATEEMSTASDQISGDIEVIASISQGTSKSSEQVSQSSSGLAELSSNLKNIVGQFKLD